MIFLFSLKQKTNLCDEKSREEKFRRQKRSTTPPRSQDTTRRRSTLKSRTKSTKLAERSKVEYKKSFGEKFRAESPSKLSAGPSRPNRRLQGRTLSTALRWKSQNRSNLQRRSGYHRLLLHLHHHHPPDHLNSK